MAKRGVIIANTGSPEAPEPAAVRRYLAAFLSDPRICPMNPLAWKLILHACILPHRSVASAKKYRSIWTPAGSPLAVGMTSLARKLEEAERAQGRSTVVRHAMSYAAPSFMDALDDLRQHGCDELTVVPLYPQSAFSTTEAVADKATTTLDALGWQVPMLIVRGYSHLPHYRDAIACSIRDAGFDARAGDRLLFAFHSIPQADIAAGDTYGEQAHATAKAVAALLALAPEEWDIGFQCRFDRNRRWLGPFMPDVLERMAQMDRGTLFVVAPNFALDCLETLYDIDMQLRDIWTRLTAGARPMRVIPCLNDSDAHVRLISELIQACPQPSA